MDIQHASESRIDSQNDINKEKTLLSEFRRIRKLTRALTEPLEVEDFVVQPVVDVSPPKWHLAHTTWFFEELILKEYVRRYKEFNNKYGFLFNSYYESVGERTLRPDRGNITRPGVKEIFKYRDYVETNIEELLTGNAVPTEIRELITLGLNHEQQHQELLITDLKYILGHNPTFPVYRESANRGWGNEVISLEPDWLTIEEGICSIGFNGSDFHFDNERGRHKSYLHSFRIMDRVVTNGEFLDFMESGGYENFRWWLSEGWDWVNRGNIHCPMYWYKIDGKWMQYTLGGLKELDRNEPVTHISFFEADAYAQWKDMRIPTEFEWEIAAAKYGNSPDSGTFLDDELFHPTKRRNSSTQFFGDVWEWTNSAYLPYPYFKKVPGAVGEYNGKFMINQKVLRGGSCATPRDHIRLTYRNFFHPHLRWQFNGLRLAETLE